MTTTLQIRAATQADADYLLADLGLRIAHQAGHVLAAGVVAYSYLGPVTVAGAQLQGVGATVLIDPEVYGRGALDALMDELRRRGSLYEGTDPLVSWLGHGSYQAPTGWEWIKHERDRRKLSCGYQAAGHWFHSDPISRDQQLGLVIAGSAGLIPPGLQWKTMSGEFVPMTAQLAQQVFAAAMVSDGAHHAVAEAARAAYEAGTLTDLQAIAWPAGYTGEA